MIVDHQLQPTHDLNVRSTVALIAPRFLREETQVSLAANRTVYESRETIKKILSGEDPRMFVVVGPCSIHDPIGLGICPPPQTIDRSGSGSARSW